MASNETQYLESQLIRLAGDAATATYGVASLKSEVTFLKQQLDQQRDSTNSALLWAVTAFEMGVIALIFLFLKMSSDATRFEHLEQIKPPTAPTAPSADHE